MQDIAVLNILGKAVAVFREAGSRAADTARAKMLSDLKFMVLSMI